MIRLLVWLASRLYLLALRYSKGRARGTAPQSFDTNYPFF